MVEIITLESLRGKTSVFKDREHAGRLLADLLEEYHNDHSSVVVAVPAGGVPVAYVIVSKLNLLFTVALSRKLHIPWNPEAGFGAVTWNGVIEVNWPLTRQLGLSQSQIERVIEDESKEIERRRNLYNLGEFPDLHNRRPIIVDDGIASGFSLLATIKAVRKYEPKEIIVAVPTAPQSSIERIEPYVDRIFCLNVRVGLFFAVASAYQNWYDVTDSEVIEYIEKIRTNNVS